jgi:hypothetical protein
LALGRVKQIMSMTMSPFSAAMLAPKLPAVSSAARSMVTVSTACQAACGL